MLSFDCEISNAFNCSVGAFMLESRAYKLDNFPDLNEFCNICADN